MAKVLIDIPENMYTHVSTSDAYVLDDTDWILLENAIANGVPLDGLTNGEVIEKMFPDAKFCCTERLQTAGLPRRDADFDLDFWNAKWGEKA